MTLPLIAENSSVSAGTNDVLSHSDVETNISIDQLKDILGFCNISRSRVELQEYCGYKSAPYFREKI